MMAENNIEYIKPKGVQNIIDKFCMTIGILPSSYKSALTYEEQILCIGKYLEETVYPAINNNAQALAQLQSLFAELKNYVDNYFDNLNVQEEINNKLDDMAESGTLQEIITAYLNIKGVLGFNTVNEMKSATNLVNGSFAKTYGLNTYNDGKGEFYKIRALINTDVIDGVNIIALTNYPTLIAEKMANFAINEINNNIDNIESNIDNIETDINNMKKDTIVAIGDSWTATTNNTSIWKTLIASGLNYNIKNYSKSGCGFITGDKTFMQQAQEAVADTTLNKNKVAFVIVIGGVNDVIYSSGSFSNLMTPIQILFEYLQNNFHCQIIFVPNYRYPFNRQLTLWNDVAKFINYTSLVKMCNIVPLQNYAHFADDKFHLTQDGQRFFTANLIKCMFGGKLNSFIYRESFSIQNKIYCVVNQWIDGEIVHVSLYGYFFNTPSQVVDSHQMTNDLPVKFIDSHLLYATMADNMERAVKPYIEFKLVNNNYFTFAYQGNDVSSDSKYDFHLDFQYHVDNIQLDS